MRWLSQSGTIWDMGPRFPVLDANRQSSIPGLYLAGDVTGTPDIKAAINTGAEVARHLLRQEIICKPPCDAHVIIIGGGPAGVSAALEFEKALREGRWPPEAGRRHTSGAPLDKLGVSAPSEAVRPPTSLRKAQSFSDDRDVGAKAPTPPHTGYLLLEKKKLFATIHSFAKCKPLFYASTGAPDVRGGLWWEEIAPGAGIQSCDVLAEWEKQLAGTDLNVRLGEAVTDIQKTDKFRIVTQSDDGGKRSYVCDRVILCIGKLIYLLKLDVGAEAEPKVFYEPPEPGKLRDRDVLVVGGTNEALETALALAAENRVTLACPPRNNSGAKAPQSSGSADVAPPFDKLRVSTSFRKGATPMPKGACEFPDAEPALVKELEVAMAAGRLNVLAETRVREVTPDAVVLSAPGAPALRLKNDVVFPLLGVEHTELPVGFFRKIHVAYERDWDWRRYLLFLAAILGVGTFYVLKKFMPGVVMVGAPTWLGLPGNEWDLASLYPLLYTVVVAGFGLRAIRRWRRQRWRVHKQYGGQQTLRLASLIFFQTVFFFLVPLFIVKDWRAWGLFYPWPLVFHPATLEHFKASAFWWWWSLGLILLAVPVATLLVGKRYCTWVCGCGGLAETLGDQWRHYSPKGVGNTKKERQIYFVTGFAAVATVLVAAGYDLAVAGVTLSAVYSHTVDLFLIAIIPVALYGFMGGKIWCRYWCPVVGVMNLVDGGVRKLSAALHPALRGSGQGSRFRISADKHRCIACNLCARYCEVGVDVMRFAVKGEAFGMWNSSCIGCGICIHVCPTDVLTFGHHQLVTLPTAPPRRK